MIPILIITFIFSAWALYAMNRRLKQNITLIRCLKKEPDFMPHPNPIFGILTEFRKLQSLGYEGIEAVKKLNKLATTYPAQETGLAIALAGNIFSPLVIIVPTRTEVLKAILSSKQRIDKGIFYNFVDVFGGGLAVSDKIRWAKTRKILNPIFHQEMLQNFVPVMSDKCQNLVSKIEIKTINGAALVSDFTELTSEIIMAMLIETVIGSPAENLNPLYREYAERLDKMQIARLQSPYKLIKPLYMLTEEGRTYHQLFEFLKSESRRLILDRINQLEDDGETHDTGRRPALLDALLREHFKNPENMTIDMIVGEVMTFLVAGWDTTTWTSTFFLQMVGSHPNVQEKIHQEIDQEFDGVSDDHLLTLKDISKLKYLECALNETLRFIPLVNVYLRHIYEDLEFEVDGRMRTIPGGSEIIIDSDIIHRNPRYWKNPDRFIPERFLPENSIGRDPHAFLAFSHGPRGCIGKTFAMCQGKMFLAQILRKFKVSPVKTIDQIIIDNSGAAKRSKDPIEFVFQPRVKCVCEEE